MSEDNSYGSDSTRKNMLDALCIPAISAGERKLPYSIMDRVNYGLTVRAYNGQWTASYDWGNDRFGSITADGDTIEDALNTLLHIFETHEAFKYHRHLLK